MPPFLAKSDDNPDSPLTKEAAGGMEAGLKSDRDAFFPQFVHDFFTANGELKVSQAEVDSAIELSEQPDRKRCWPRWRRSARPTSATT